MAVRFLPPPEERQEPPREERANLAEVIELRSKLAPATDSDSESGGEPAGATSAWAERSVKRDACGYIEDTDDGEDIYDAEETDDSEDTGPVVPVLTAAIKLLARRALSSGELQRSLVLAGYPELDAEQAVAECEEALYLNDEDLARAVTQKLRDSKGASRSNIRQKLRERALSPAAIEAAVDELDDDDEYALIQQTARDRARRLRDLDRQTAERRLLGFLARRGWSGEQASRAAREALDDAGVARSGGPGSTVRFR